MSRFETSKFVRNASVMNQECLIEACQKLNWKYNKRGDELFITDIGIKQSFGSEFAIKVKGNDVIYNTYYLGNTKDYVQKLQGVYNKLNVEYSKTTVINEFKKKGFTFKSNDKFVATEQEKVSFFMVGRSKDKIETEPVGQIKFTIFNDGTIVSDSNYLPADVNTLAHAAMDGIDLNFSSKRVMTKKEVPLKYKDRMNKTIQVQTLNKK
ncbi:MAG: hypothetical protein LBC68_08870 [Prevotellaceae bacterium]|jgi:hypothetical protein|nr:hypothetical protein [Prevotellaceae bacterium]